MSLITQQLTASHNMQALQALPFAYKEEMEEQQLRQRIQALAQELQDLIFNFTTAVETNEVIAIDATYRTPKALRINSKTRRARAHQYYSTNAFLLDSDYPLKDFLPGFEYFDSTGFREWWLRNLPHEHSLMIRDVRLPLCDTTTAICDARPNREGLHATYGRPFLICINI